MNEKGTNECRSEELRVRFAPSPTGHLHVGGARTALFNWLFARNKSGTFILRIEDTDRTRSTEKSIDQITDSLQWLGLDWDEYYRQTERTDLYREVAQDLTQKGKAYESDGALWFEVPGGQTVLVEDLVLGKVEYETDELKDFVIRRSDGTFTYNFACVVDDSRLGVTHVMRGDDHLNNTPKQILIYDDLDVQPPQFAHFPMILDENHKRLSKRSGSVSVLDYRNRGILPETLVNFLARLGWSHGNQEIFSRQQLVEYFDLGDVGESSAVFDEEKLIWMNHEWLKRLEPKELLEPFRDFLASEEVLSGGQAQKIKDDKLAKLIDHLRERNKTLVQLAEASRFVFSEELDYGKTPIKDHLTDENKELVGKLAERLQEIPQEKFQPERIEQATRDCLENEGGNLGQIAQVCRIGLTGREVSPGLFTTMELVGKEKTIQRLSAISELDL